MTKPGMSAVQERAAIVAWLRSDALKGWHIAMPDIVEIAHEENGVWWNERRHKITRQPNARDFADAIERGEHIAPQADDAQTVEGGKL